MSTSNDAATTSHNEAAAPATATATARIAERAHEAIDRVSGQVEKSEHALRERAAQAEAQAREAADTARKQADQSLAQVRDYVRENPLTSAAIAFGAGYLLSALMRK